MMADDKRMYQFLLGEVENMRLSKTPKTSFANPLPPRQNLELPWPDLPTFEQTTALPPRQNLELPWPDLPTFEQTTALPPRQNLELPWPDLPTFEQTTVTWDEVSIAGERNRLLKWMLCVLCEARFANVVLLPCMHHMVCEQCAAGVTMCPVCGQTATEKIKTIFA